MFSLKTINYLILICLHLPIATLNDAPHYESSEKKKAGVHPENISNTAGPDAAGSVVSEAFMADQLIEDGSLIIDMGVVPQTHENGLQPYGLIFDLIKNHKVPVLWAINPNKINDKDTGYDDVDFVYNSQSFKGGPFIIQADYRTAAVNSTIDDWEALGVVTVEMTSDATLPIFIELSGVPNWTLDAANGSNLFAGFNAAGIPEFNNGDSGDPNYVFKEPQYLDCCDYLYAMPHADPVWSTHSNLGNWVLNDSLGGCRGWIWAACHAVSALENSFDDQTPDVTQQMNFLSNKTGDANIANAPWAENSLVIWGDHANGDGNFDYDSSTSADPFMQFMSTLDGAVNNGSERIYMPYAATSWRNTTTVSIYDANQPDVQGGGIGSPRAAIMAYGPAYGVGSYSNYASGNGWVMYETGHAIGGSETEFVAAYRAFFNFSLMSAFERGVDIIYSVAPPAEVEQETTINLTASASGSTGPYIFEWFTDPAVGTFGSNPITRTDGVDASTTWTAPSSVSAYDITFTLTITDACGIEKIISQIVTIVPSETAPACTNEIETIAPNSDYILDLTELTSDINNNLPPSGFSIYTYPANGDLTIDGNGIATYTPNFNYLGTDSYSYQATDDAGNTCTGTVSILVDCPSGTNDNQIWGTVFNDNNGDGTLNSGDTGYTGMPTINLYKDDSPNDGIPDGPAVQTTTANASGTYNFIIHDDYFDTLEYNFNMTSYVDDAREKNSGQTENDKPDHKFTKDGDDSRNGFRFNNITIPYNAVIDSASITFTSADGKSGAGAHARFFAQDNTANAPGFNDCGGNCYDITARDHTANYIDWMDIEDWLKDVTYTTPDLTNIVQEIVNDQGGLSNGSIAFLVYALGPQYSERKTYSYDTDPTKAPVLFVRYSVPVPGAEYRYIVEIDESTLLPDDELTTLSQLAVQFNAQGTSECLNNFGIGIPCRTIFSNRFIMYKRQ